MSAKYEAFFVKNHMTGTLSKVIEHQHVTITFMPTKPNEHLYGIGATFTVTGYGNDGLNEGYRVRLKSCENEELVQLYNSVPVPHITLSIGAAGKAVNTANLEFEDVEPFDIYAVFGGFNERPYFQ